MWDKKDKIIAEALKHIEKQYGKGAVIKMWETTIGDVKVNHSGAYVLDIVLGWWYPEGRVVEVYGPESSGKTTMTLLAIAEAQRRWENCAFIDAEHALDPTWARTLGVNTDELYLSQPDFWEQALSIVEDLAKTGAFKMIVVDSVAALTPRAEVEGDMWDSHMWLQARMMSQWLRKLTSVLAKTGTTVVFINQIRMKIGVMFWNPETTTWGNALKFYATQRLEVRKSDKIMFEKEQIWYHAKVKIKKNKIAPPFKVAMVPIMFESWLDEAADILEAWLMLGCIEKNWAFYTIWGQKFQGRAKASQFLMTDHILLEWLRSEVKSKLKDLRKGKIKLDDEIGKDTAPADIWELADAIDEAPTETKATKKK